jgi:hypothetical protein
MKRATLTVPILIGLLVVLATFVPREPESDRAWGAVTTTYSPGPNGTKALFLLLDRIGLETSRLRRPGYGQLSPGTVLWSLTREPFGRNERRELVRFLGKGGTLVAPPQALVTVLDEARLGTPKVKEQGAPLVTVWGMKLELEGAPLSLDGAAEPVQTFATAPNDLPVVAAWKIGEGRAVSLGVDQLTENGRIGRADNGVFLARLALALGKRHVFDEFRTGFGDGGLVALLAHVPYRWAMVQLVLLGAVGLLALARRRLPAESPEPARRRRTLDHVEAVARLWEQARDAGLPLGAVLSAAAERARHRLGGTTEEKAFIAWIERARPELSSRARSVWERAEQLALTARPSVEDARRAAVDIMRLEEDGLGW